MKMSILVAALLVSGSSFATDLCSGYQLVKCTSSAKVGRTTIINLPTLTIENTDYSFVAENNDALAICQLFVAKSVKATADEREESSTQEMVKVDGNGSLIDLVPFRVSIYRLICVE